MIRNLTAKVWKMFLEGLVEPKLVTIIMLILSVSVSLHIMGGTSVDGGWGEGFVLGL